MNEDISLMNSVGNYFQPLQSQCQKFVYLSKKANLL